MRKCFSLFLILCFIVSLSSSGYAADKSLSIQMHEPYIETLDKLSEDIGLQIPYVSNSDGSVTVTLSSSSQQRILSGIIDYYDELNQIYNPNNMQNESMDSIVQSDGMGMKFGIDSDGGIRVGADVNIIEFSHNEDFTNVDVKIKGDTLSFPDLMILFFPIRYAAIYQIFCGTPEEKVEVKFNIYDTYTGKLVLEDKI